MGNSNADDLLFGTFPSKQKEKKKKKEG